MKENSFTINLPDGLKLVSVEKGLNPWSYLCLTRQRREEEKPEHYQLKEFKINDTSDEWEEVIFQEH